MKDSLRILSQYPELGITSSLGSGLIHWLGILNPILSFISLIIGITIGIITIYMKLNN